MDSTTQKMHLRIPQQTLSNLSFAEGSEKGIAQWLANLPKANIGETARQLYQGLIELNQYNVPADKRMAMLERIRPEVHYVCTALSRYYLGQSIVLEDKPRKVANLSQSLQNHLANGYKIIVAQERSIKSRDHANLMTLALQRSIRGLCGPLLRAFQLYCPVADGVWLELHQLYQLARKRGLHQTPVPDSESADRQALSIEQCYLVALLMGAARPNQMRQSAMGKLFATLEDWSRHTRLVAPDDSKALFIINPDMDCPPRYKSLIRGESLDHSLGLDTRRLVSAIKEFMTAGSAYRGDLHVPNVLGIELLQHVSQSWGDLAERTFNRIPSQGHLRVSIGMSATHYRISGKSFARMTDASEAEMNPFSDAAQKAKQGGWTGAFDGAESVEWHASGIEQIDYGNSIEEQDEEGDDQYPIHSLPIVNHSPGGFCLTWPKEVPKQLQAGELLGIQEANEQDWSLAVVRWIRQVRGGGTQMGIELIAPHCTPCAAKLIRKTGEPSQYLRALLLPAVNAIDRPATIITPRLPFQVNSKIHLLHGGKTEKANLNNRVTATGSFSQFEYQLVDQTPMQQAHSETNSASLSAGPEDDFDSLWKSL